MRAEPVVGLLVTGSQRRGDGADVVGAVPGRARCAVGRPCGEAGVGEEECTEGRPVAGIGGGGVRLDQRPQLGPILLLHTEDTGTFTQPRTVLVWRRTAA